MLECQALDGSFCILSLDDMLVVESLCRSNAFVLRRSVGSSQLHGIRREQHLDCSKAQPPSGGEAHPASCAFELVLQQSTCDVIQM